MGKLSEPSKEEVKILSLKKIEKGYSLACQAEALEGEVLIEVVDEGEIKSLNCKNDFRFMAVSF